jgi:lipoprotein-anchoring transpeptidase ErfK/SrfK
VGRNRAAVPLLQPVRVASRNGTLEKVAVSSKEGALGGRLSSDGSSWRGLGRLEPGTRYTVRAVARRSDGQRRTLTSHFTTQALTLAQQTFPSIAPLNGETVGIGMPVIVTFDVPVTDKASIEKHLKVTSVPAQKGSWHWISDQEVHWRPVHYWRAGTDVTVDADINSIPAGAGVFGQLSRQITFHVGDAHVYRVNTLTHQMQVGVNGQVVRTIPITTGKDGFTTRSGTKVIIEKFRHKRMNSETIGIGKNNPEHYDLDNVEYAMRVTYSGEFIHAAPWSVGSQGFANVSHGCTGMSTANAAWLYSLSRRGDVVEYSGTDRWMTLTNGYGDWNEDFGTYAAGSALH